MNILNKLTIKHLKMNKKRTVVTIIGIILSTALMIGIGLLFSTFREYMIDETIMYNGSYHVSFEDVPKDKLSIITNNVKIKDYFYAEELGFSYLENGQNEYKPYLKLLGVNEEYFKELNLVSGRFPSNDNEVVISNHIESNGGVKLEIGDTLTLNLGSRILDSEEVKENYFIEGETLKVNNTKEYKIVGIVERSVYEDYSCPGYSVFTLYTGESENVNTYVHFKKIKDTYNVSNDIASKLGYENVGAPDYVFYKEVNYNSSLLAMYGVSNYRNIIEGISGILAIILGLISVGCIIVIYNSFAISVMERKKQFGLFSSIGATKAQIRKTVFFEAFVVGSIGIILGLLSGLLGISIVIAIVNNLLPSTITLKLSIYPLFIIIPIIFMIIVIIISAFIPSFRASKITPIEAIRLNDDIKIKGKKLKTNFLVRKIFGIEGDIALKNIKRNKKKYRITVISLFISIVMFITFSSFIDYVFKGVDDVSMLPDYDIIVYLNSGKLPIDTKDDTINKILSHEQVDDKFIISSSIDYVTNTDFSKIYTDEFNNKISDSLDDSLENVSNINLVVVNDEKYSLYLKTLGYNEEKPILLNIKRGVDYTTNSRKNYEIKKYKSNNLDINICDVSYNEVGEVDNINCNKTINDYYLANIELPGLSDFLSNIDPVIIISDKMNEYYADGNFNSYIVLKAKKYDKLDKMLDQISTESDDIQYTNVTENMRLLNNIVLAIKILVYGFISLVTLIGVTSVFNTINTSIALRRKEFAVLRSIGLTPHGFNKMLYFESIMFGLKSLLYALPVSICLVYLVHLSMNNIINFETLILPIKSILIAIFAVFIIVIITMMYASSKIKHENILEAIREENI